MEKNINSKNKYLIIISIILIIGGYSLSTNNKLIKDITLSKIFPLNQVEAYSTVPSTSVNTDGTVSTTTYTSTITRCNNGATNPPTCTQLSNGRCVSGDNTYPNCTTVTGFNKTYLPMAANGLDLTAGIVQTKVNVDDARKKYLAAISETNSIKQELKDIMIAYNKIIEDAQLKRNQTFNTGSNNFCTFSELIQYQQD